MNSIKPKARCSSAPWPRKAGVTLLEVVVGLALMGTLLAGALIAHSVHVRQLKTAHLKLEATLALDRFLTCWASSGFRQSDAAEAAKECELPFQMTQEPSSVSQTAFVLQIVPQDRTEELRARTQRVEVRHARSFQLLSWAEVLAYEP